MSSQRRAETILLTGLVLVMTLGACGKSNNVLLGRVEAKVGTHLVIVTDCYRTSVSPPQLLSTADSTRPLYRFSPCVDADVVFNGDQLIVNGVHYGTVQPQDSVTVDHGKVLVNNQSAARMDPVN